MALSKFQKLVEKYKLSADDKQTLSLAVSGHPVRQAVNQNLVKRRNPSLDMLQSSDQHLWFKHQIKELIARRKL